MSLPFKNNYDLRLSCTNQSLFECMAVLSTRGLLHVSLQYIIVHVKEANKLLFILSFDDLIGNIVSNMHAQRQLLLFSH